MKKKWIILICVILIVVITAIVLSFTLFTVQTINIDYKTSLTAEYDSEQIIAKSKIPKGKNIFFLKKQTYINNIEEAYPYLEVINIETSFPSTLTIHVRERQALYAVKYGQGYLILDSAQKVLEKVDDISNLNVVLVDYEIEKREMFLNIPYITSLYDAFLQNGKSLSDELGIIKEIKFFDEQRPKPYNEQPCMNLTLRSGREVYLHNCGYALAWKLAKFFAVEEVLPSLSPQLSDEVINKSEIHIDNRLSPDADESDCGWYLVYEGKRIEKENYE